MKAQFRWRILAGLAVLLLFGFGVRTWHQRSKAPAEAASSATIPSPPIMVSALPSEKGDASFAPRHSQESSSQADEVREARGSGYMWGSALNSVYASGTLTSGTKRHLNVTELGKAFRGFRRPVDLEDASALPVTRAEYFASVISAALDLDTTQQPEIAGLLQSYYATDSNSRELDETKQASERSRLSREARTKMLALLPVESQTKFEEIFAAPDFLFKSMSLAADAMTFETGGGTALGSGGVVLTLNRNGEIEFQSGSMSVEQKPKSAKGSAAFRRRD